MARIKLRDFSKYLHLSPPEDAIPDNALRRARGINSIKTLSARSRWGNSKINPYNAQSIFVFNSALITFDGTQLIVGSSTLALSSSNSLSFLSFPPNADQEDYLLISNGGTLYKMSPYPDYTFTQWGISPPDNGFTAALSTASTRTFGWIAAGALTAAVSSTAEISDTTSVDLSTFSDAAESSDADYIFLSVKITNPDNFSNLQIIFSLGDTAFTTNTLAKTIGFNSSSSIENTTTSGQITSSGLGSTSYYSTAEQEEETQAYVSQEDYAQGATRGAIITSTRNALQKDSVSYANSGTWETLYIAKSSFQRFGSDDLDWSDVQGVKLIATANSGGSVVVDYSLISMSGAVGMQGDYRYYITYYNENTTSESNPNSTPVLIENINRQPVVLSSIPQSSDAQVTHINIYRTVGDGSVPFYCNRIAAGTTTYTDTVGDCYILDPRSNAVLLSSDVVNFYNIVPASTFGRIASFNASVFWTQTLTATSGNLYYSRIGHAESNEGFIRVTSSSDPLQIVCLFNGFLYTFSQKHLFRITGTNPYYSTEVFGVPGTRQPDTVAITPYGIIYQAPDGVRLFNGSTSERVGWQAVSRLFSGEDVENLTAFTGTCGAFYRDEYYISDGSQTLVYHLKDQTWRDLGVGFDCLYADHDTLYGGNYNGVYSIEVPNTLTNEGEAIAFALQTKQIMLDVDREVMVNHLFIDADTSDQTLTVTLITDKGEEVLGICNTPSRRTTPYPIGKNYNRFGLRLVGELTNQVEIFGIEFDVDPSN